jgi:hypothetical protein
LPNNRPRRQRPKSKQDRSRLCEVNRLLNTRGLTDERRAELEAERDLLSPMLQPPTREDLERLIERVEAKQASGSSLPGGSSASKSLLWTEEKMEAAMQQLLVYDRENALRKARSASDAARVAALLSELPNHPLNLLAREVGDWLWREDKSYPKPAVTQTGTWKVHGWLKREPYNRADVHGNVATVANAVDDAYRLLAERDAEDPLWFVRRAEKLFDGGDVAMTQRSIRNLSDVELHVEPSLSAPTPVRPAPGTTDLAKQVSLILQIDAQHLGRLAAHSHEYNDGIRAAITRQLQACGHCDGVFLANVYNAMRPKGLSAFPPRQF